MLKEYKLEDFEIVNLDKWERALHGTLGAQGKLEGGVGDDATDLIKLAEYDKLGGLIRKDNHRIKTGSFWDIKARSVRENPVIEFLFTDLEGNEVIIPEGESVPLEVHAAEMIKAKKSAVAGKKKDKKTVARIHGGTEVEEKISVSANVEINADDE